MVRKFQYGLLVVAATIFMFSCNNQTKKKPEATEVVEEVIDTITVTDSLTHVQTKVIYDTVYIKVKSKKETVKEKAPSLSAWSPEKRKKIERFVKSVSDKGSKSYLNPADRIAVFDNEGTLWPEQPVYFQLEFMFDRIKAMAKDHPEWKKDKLIQAVLNDDIKKIKRYGGQGLFKLSQITQSGMTTEEYRKIVLDWINKAKHPETGKRYRDMVYLPMSQLIDYLKHYHFKVFLVTEGGSGFLSPWSEQVFGIPPEYILASLRRLEYTEQDGKHVLIRDPEILYINNDENKVISIEQRIGKRPVVAFGNSDSDIPMLEWTSENQHKHLVGIIHHTDAQREWAYDKDTKIGKLSKGLKLAQDKGWMVVDMKNDWKKIYH